MSGLENVLVPEIIHLILLCQLYMKNEVSRQLSCYLCLTVTLTLICYFAVYCCCFTTNFVPRPVGLRK
jgi:hypothetical protein